MEWEVEVNSWHTDNAHDETNATHALASTLKLPMPGFRNPHTGKVSNVGSSGEYWSASAERIYSRTLTIYSNLSRAVQSTGGNDRDFGLTVRCIKNEKDE